MGLAWPAIPPAILAAVVGLIMASCDRSPSSATVQPTPGDGVYTVRGRIESLPGTRPGSMLRVHHEHIPNFKNRDGEIHRNRDGTPGMLEMSMEFPVAPGVDLSGLAVGDAVELTFEVQWNRPPPPYAVTAIRKLPAGTELRLSKP